MDIQPGDRDEILKNFDIPNRRYFWQVSQAGDANYKAWFYIPPESIFRNEHVHPIQTEYVTVMLGELSLLYAGEPVIMKEGEQKIITPGIKHRLTNDSGSELVVQLEFDPGLESGLFFKNYFGLVKDERINAQGEPHILQAAVMLTGRFKDYSYSARLPLWLQHIVAVPLGFIGRLLGYKDSYPKYESGEYVFGQAVD